MVSAPLARRMALAVGASAVVGMGMLTACGTEEKPAENPAPSSPSATAPVSPSVKSPGANRGPNAGSSKDYEGSFAPTVTARPAPTALPGNVITGG